MVRRAGAGRALRVAFNSGHQGRYQRRDRRFALKKLTTSAKSISATNSAILQAPANLKRGGRRWPSLHRIPLLFGAAFLVLIGCTPPVDLEAEKANVRTVVDQFEKVWETEDMQLFSKIMAHDADMVNFVSDAPEHFIGWDALKKAAEEMFPAFENTNVTVRDQVIRVHPAGQAAWFSRLWGWSLEVKGQPVRLEGCRFTGVLEKRNGEWVFVPFHNSVPVR